MFSIENLITADIDKIIGQKINNRAKAEVLLNLIEFEENYVDQSEEIGKLWFSKTGERYSSSAYFLSNDDKEFLLEYAEKIGNFENVKKLLDKLCSINEGVYDYDEVISEAENEINIISDISNAMFSDYEDKNEHPKKTSIHLLLSRKMWAMK